MKRIKIYNANIITPYRLIKGGSLLIDDGKIAAVSAGNIEANDAAEIDAHEQFVAPGFIDIHIHGGGGSDFMDATVESFLKVAETHVQYGTTAMLPTSLTAETKDIIATLKTYEQAKKLNTKGSAFLGMHLEGPYFSINQRGAQDPAFIREANPEEYEYILASSDAVARWSAAPEIKGALTFGSYLKSKGIVVSAAHTDATYEHMLDAFEHGYTLATHLYSGMSGVTRKNAFRYAGVVESAFLMDEMDVEIICDGIHLPAALLKLVYKIKGAGRIALITDAMRAAGTQVKESVLGNIHSGSKVIVEDGVAKLPDRSSFAGSIATADRLVWNMIHLGDVSLTDAVMMITSTPARIMNCADTTGSLTVGKDADIVIFDSNISIQKTFVKGKLLYEKKQD